MDVIVKESKNDLDLIIKFIDFEVLCVLIKVLAKLKNSIHEMVLLGYSITTKEDEITISNKKSGKLLTVKLENSENTSDKKTYKVEIRHRIKEVVKKDSKTVSMKYSYIIMSGDIRNHDSIEEINEDDLKGLARKVATTNSNGIYRIINYLSDDRIEDYEFANIIQMLKTDAIKSQLFDSNDLRDIIDQLNGEYKKSALDNESGEQEESTESITFNEQPNSEPVENDEAEDSTTQELYDESGDYEGQFFPGRRGAYRKYRLAELRDKHNYTL